MRLYIGLVHYPVYNKNYQKIAAALTTLDIHDIARVARTYDIKRFFIITPLEDQRALAERIRNHWLKGYGAGYNRHRKEAIELISVVRSLEEATDTVAKEEGEASLLIATDASKQKNRSISYKRAQEIISENRVVVLIFGTAWGLDQEVLNQADYILAPISGMSGYNHLSVRSAAAITIDRLMGRYCEQTA